MGSQFQKRNSVKIEMGSSSFSISNGTQVTNHALVDNNFNENPITVYSHDNYIIPARSQRFIECKLSCEQCDLQADWCSVANVCFVPFAVMHEQYNLLFPNCLTPVKQGLIRIHVANTTGEPVVLRSGTRCGLAEACDSQCRIYCTYVNGERVGINSESGSDIGANGIK
jgi:hypothetical protein